MELCLFEGYFKHKTGNTESLKKTPNPNYILYFELSVNASL